MFEVHQGYTQSILVGNSEFKHKLIFLTRKLMFSAGESQKATE